MKRDKAEPILVITVRGPATKDGRIALKDLMALGKHVQSSVERVATVLSGKADSRKPGRRPKKVVESCPLEVVALNQGSFEIALDLPRDTFEFAHLGVESIEKLVEGIESISTNGSVLPSGFDTGVLYSLRDLGRLLDKGVDEIEVTSRTQRLQRQVSYNPTVQNRIIEKIRGPVTSERTIEGRLLMADFRHDVEKCRIHPTVGEPIVCQFDESLEETVYEHLRGFVRITGETKEDPITGRITSIKIQDIEALSIEGEEFDTITADSFWEERSLEELATEQNVQPLQKLEQILGSGSSLWSDDEDFEEFLVATSGAEGGVS